jgi:putative transcriptional regulator
MNRPKTNQFLLASSHLNGSYFQDKVVYLIEHNSESSYGLIINFTASMPINEVFNGIHKKYWKPYRFAFGGPVQEDLVQILQFDYSRFPGAKQIAPGIFMGGTWDFKGNFFDTLLQEASIRLFLGYSGWGPGQLDSEFDEGCWDLLDQDPLTLFKRPSEELLVPASQYKKQFQEDN